MKINSRYKMESCVLGNEPTRPALQMILVTKRHAVATDGKILAVVPIETEKEDAFGYLPPKVLTAARKVDKKQDEIEIRANGAFILSDGTSFPRPDDELVGSYPKLAGVVSVIREPEIFSVAFDASLLSDLCSALGTSEVTLSFADGDRKAIRVRPTKVDEEGPWGLLMPQRKSQ